MTHRDLESKLRDKPFRPFRIKLVKNTAYDITRQWMMIIGETRAVVVTQVRKDDGGYETAQDWRTISISHILELSDIEMKDRDRKRKPA